MRTATVKELKYELGTRSKTELIEVCLRLSKFKKENKELLTYLLYDSGNEAAFIEQIKKETGLEFNAINTSSYFYIKKSIRRILRDIKKYIKYSKKKETEVELLIYFCSKFKGLGPFIGKNTVLEHLYFRQTETIKKTLSFLHEDLQYDYGQELKALTENENLFTS